MPPRKPVVDPKKGSLGNIRERNKAQGDAMADAMASINQTMGGAAPKTPPKKKR